MRQEEAWLLQEKYAGKMTDGYLRDCERLKRGEPLAYVIGHIPFAGTSISLASHPLIPRPETEFWVTHIIPMIGEKNARARVLDLCAGSGCIGIAVLKALPHTHVDFGELQTEHHATIRENVRRNAIDPARTTIVGGDLYEFVKNQYDVILSNPPYIDPALNRTEESVRGFEPHEALYGGTGGLEIIARVIQGAPKHLSHDGILIIEHEPEQTDQIAEVAATNGFTAQTERDQYGVLRYSLLTQT